MTKAFENRVKKEMTVDTRKYRYIYKIDFAGAKIERCPLEHLSTTKALDPWEIVK